MKIQSLFPTRLAEAGTLPYGLLDDLSQAIWMLEDGDAAGQAWSEAQGYDGYTSYASLDDLPARATAFSVLKSKLDVWANEFATAHGWDLGSQALTLSAMWVNILGEGGQHSGHIHPGSVISGTTYIDVTADTGALKFEDPRLAMLMAAPPLVDAPETNQQRFVYVQPQKGMTLMWESWLRHEVMPNNSERPRLSISFNYGLQEK